MTLPTVLDKRNGDIHIAALPENRVAKNKLELVFDNRYRNPELDRGSGLALGYPARMLLEHRENLLAVRDRFALQNPAVDLIDLTTGMAQVAGE